MKEREMPVIVEKRETGERQKGLIVRYRERSHYKVVLCNLFEGRHHWWHGDKRGFSGCLDTNRSWKEIKNLFNEQGYFSLWCDYRVYPAEKVKKTVFEEINL